MGYSRDSFYRFQELYDKGGELALQELSRRKPVLKNRAAPEVEQAVVAIAIEQPSWGQARVANELLKRGISVSPFGVRCIWLRHDLATTKLRLKALEPRMAQEQLILTEGQLAALEKAKADKGGPWRVRHRLSRLLRRPGHLLRWHSERRRPDLPADLCRYLLKSGVCQALRPEKRHYFS